MDQLPQITTCLVKHFSMTLRRVVLVMMIFESGCRRKVSASDETIGVMIRIRHYPFSSAHTASGLSGEYNGQTCCIFFRD